MIIDSGALAGIPLYEDGEWLIIQPIWGDGCLWTRYGEDAADILVYHVGEGRIVSWI